jgi:Na+-translocating ferredoxin:NAD+ oxidoreductase RnfD subunit
LVSLMPFDLLTIAGVAGSGFIIAAYFFNQHGLLRSEDWRYLLANLSGALLILLSLVTAWNLPAAVMEVFWALISLYGLIKHGGRQL